MIIMFCREICRWMAVFVLLQRKMSSVFVMKQAKLFRQSFKYLGLTEVTDEQVEAVTYAHGSKDTLKRDVASDLMAADDMMKRGITGIDVVKALAESGYTVLADNILNMLKQRVIGDYMQTAAILG